MSLDTQQELYNARMVARENNLTPTIAYCSPEFYMELIRQIKSTLAISWTVPASSQAEPIIQGMIIRRCTLNNKFFVECSEHCVVAPRGTNDYDVDSLATWEIFK